MNLENSTALDAGWVGNPPDRRIMLERQKLLVRMLFGDFPSDRYSSEHDNDSHYCFAN